MILVQHEKSWAPAPEDKILYKPTRPVIKATEILLHDTWEDVFRMHPEGISLCFAGIEGHSVYLTGGFDKEGELTELWVGIEQRYESGKVVIFPIGFITEDNAFHSGSRCSQAVYDALERWL